MAVSENTFEVGVAPATVITTGNSGGAAGRAFDQINGSPTFDNTHVHGGDLAMRCDLAAGDAFVRWLDGAPQAGGDTYVRFYVYFTALPSVPASLAVITNTVNAFKGRLRITAAGLLEWLDNTAASMCITTVPVALGQWVRIEGRLTTSATTAMAELRLFNTPESESPTEFVFSAASFNTLADNPAGWRFGADISGTAPDVLWMDDIAADPAGWIGPVPVPGPAPQAVPSRVFVGGDATPRAVWDQDRSELINFTPNVDPVPGSPEVGVLFVAPASGREMIIIGGMARDQGGVQRVFLRPEIWLGTGAGTPFARIEDGAFKEFATSPPESEYMAGSRVFIASGLNPGREYYARVVHYTTGGVGIPAIAAREIIAVPEP